MRAALQKNAREYLLREKYLESQLESDLLDSRCRL